MPISNLGSLISSLAKKKIDNQAEHWSRQAVRYDELFLDPYGQDVVNPLWRAMEAIPGAVRKTVADLGCGTGTLLPYLVERFESVIAIDFAPGMLAYAPAARWPRAGSCDLSRKAHGRARRPCRQA